MKIKVAFLETDKVYLSRIVSALSGKYADKIQIYSYTDQAQAIAAAEVERISVFVAGHLFEIDKESLPAHCSLVYLSDSPEVESYKGCPVICKYQKVEQIYKGILNVYSENAQWDPSIRLRNEGGAKLIIVTSPSGGAGVTSFGVALSRRLVKKNARVFYLSFEKTGSTDLYFEAPGQFTMSDVVFAVKSHRANLRLKLESCARQDNCGVFYFAAPQIALDLQELSTTEEMDLVKSVVGSGGYDYVIVDHAFGLDPDTIKLFNLAYRNVWVCNDVQSSAVKILRAYKAIEVLNKKIDCRFLQCLSVIYNRFDDKRGEVLPEDKNIDVVGAISEYKGISEEQVIQKIEGMGFLDGFV